MSTCDKYRKQFQQATADSTFIDKVGDIVFGTIDSMLYDPTVRNTMIIENGAQMTLRYMAKKVSKQAVKKVIKGFLSGYNILTDLGDVFDVFDHVFGDDFSVIMDRAGLNLYYSNVRDKFLEVFTEEYKTCLYSYIKEIVPTATDQQIQDMIARSLSLFSVSNELPDEMTINNDCVPMTQYNGVNLLTTNISGTCPLMYKQFFRGYVKNHK